MLDFLMIATRSTKRGVMEVYPKFIIKKSSDLMVRGGDFYAIWVEERGLWSTEEQDAIHLIDQALDQYAEENRQKFDAGLKVLHMWDAETGMIDGWHRYCQKQMRDSYHMLDEKLIFANTDVCKKDYASKRLPYAIEDCDISAYDKLIGTLYTPEERHKIEWAIGSVVSGESKKLQKFMVLYGAAGTGKSTILNIIQQLFDGYYSVFDAKALGSSSNSFALESFRSNPLVAIQHDGDLSKIEDNTRLNSLVSHEKMSVNEKFKASYENNFKCFLFMGTNKPVKITDAKSGLIRRLIDVSPSGNKLDAREYKTVVKQVNFEIGGIALHCRNIFLDNPGYYDDYIPMAMLGASNDFYNFVVDSYFTFKKEDGVSLKCAWEMYKTYCDEAKVSYPFSQRTFKEELRNYFWDYKERYRLDDETRARNYYSGFRIDRFESQTDDDVKVEEVVVNKDNLIKFESIKSIFDNECSGCIAQYASGPPNEVPLKKWDEVASILATINTSLLHYVKPPENHIVIDFDMTDSSGNKSFEKNLEEASKWPPTYAEISKGGNGIHLHYIYKGDVSNLSSIYEDKIEIKVFKGNSSLRRKLSKCNNIPIATISSGLPLKGEIKKMVGSDSIKSEMGLRTMIKRNLNKEIHPGTKPSIDFIYTILEDAYVTGLKYDVSDMRNAILAFAMGSTHQADYCVKLIKKMRLKSEELSVMASDVHFNDNDFLVFFDIEVFPNVIFVNYKAQGEGKPITRLINPRPIDIEMLIKYKLVGYNCRKYDNHILYAIMNGYNNEQVYNLSQKIIKNEPGAMFGNAYNLSYTDIYDFASAGNKKSLKKFEIELHLHHMELGLPWDKPVDPSLWHKVSEYCDNDVISSEKVFEHLKSDWMARQILADIASMSVNDTTNSLSTRIVFDRDKKPQSQFNYRNLAVPCKGKPHFPGYEYKNGKSTYRGEEVGEGGYVFAEPGMYGNVALLDVASMHPTSTILEMLFGEKYTAKFQEIKDARVAIKRKEFDKARTMLGGMLAKYLNDVTDATALSDALKTVINSVYGLTAAGFENAFRDPRNIDNIVAKRGALFMVDLKHAVREQGFVVAHIKTDSIKIPDATPEIIKFVMDFGAKYGYEFEHEATYEKMCLVNDAVYIAKYATENTCNQLYGYIPGNNKKHPGEWTATGTQFAVPYVFKTLFTKEKILFNDLCETKSVTSSMHIDTNEQLPDVSLYEKIKTLRTSEAVPSKKDMMLASDYRYMSDEDLDAEIAKGHDYHFVGKVGRFCPIKSGCGGGWLVREKDGKYYSATGAKGYRWLEAEMVEQLGKEGDIDMSFYNELATEAKSTIYAYGDFDWFASDNPYISPPFVGGRIGKRPEYANEVKYLPEAS